MLSTLADHVPAPSFDLSIPLDSLYFFTRPISQPPRYSMGVQLNVFEMYWKTVEIWYSVVEQAIRVASQILLFVQLSLPFFLAWDFADPSR